MAIYSTLTTCIYLQLSFNILYMEGRGRRVSPFPFAPKSHAWEDALEAGGCAILYIAVEVGAVPDGKTQNPDELKGERG